MASINELIKKWSNFVLRVEKGFDDSIYEYTNDLSVRDILEEQFSNLPEDIKNQIKVIDARFYTATLEAKKPLSSYSNVCHFTWWKRVPTHVKGELKDDLISEGII